MAVEVVSSSVESPTATFADFFPRSTLRRAGASTEEEAASVEGVADVGTFIEAGKIVLW